MDATPKKTKTTKKTTTKKNYIVANKIKINYLDTVKINKQNCAVSAVLLLSILDKSINSIVKQFAAATAQYRNGKRAVTKDARQNGNMIYLKNARKGLARQGNPWVFNAIDKIAAGKAAMDIVVSYNVVAIVHNVDKAKLIQAINKKIDSLSDADSAIRGAYRQIAAVLKTA